MEGTFIYIILIYTLLLSFGALFVAFLAPSKKLTSYLRIGFGTICIHIIYKLMWTGASADLYELPIPLGIVYPTLLYLLARSYYSNNQSILIRTKLLLFLPVFAQVVFFCIALSATPYANIQMWYSKVYYSTTMLSLLVYAAMVTALYTKYNGPSTSLDILIRQLSALCFALVVLTYLVLYETSIPKSGIGFQVRPMVYLFLAIGFALILRYLLRHKEHNRQRTSQQFQSLNSPDVGAAKPSGELSDHIIQRVDYEMNQVRLFLNPAVSLDMLSQRTAIPRHQLTQLFNRHYHKSFYQFVAQARIAYAITKIRHMDNSLTLDSLSYECGFNSKTSFNRYFKEYTGMTPSAFRTACTQVLQA